MEDRWIAPRSFEGTGVELSQTQAMIGRLPGLEIMATVRTKDLGQSLRR